MLPFLVHWLQMALSGSEELGSPCHEELGVWCGPEVSLQANAHRQPGSIGLSNSHCRFQPLVMNARPVTFELAQKIRGPAMTAGEPPSFLSPPRRVLGSMAASRPK